MTEMYHPKLTLRRISPLPSSTGYCELSEATSTRRYEGEVYATKAKPNLIL